MPWQRRAIVKQQIFGGTETQAAKTFWCNGSFGFDPAKFSLGLVRVVVVRAEPRKPKDHRAIRRVADPGKG